MTMPKLNFIPPPQRNSEDNIQVQKVQKLEVMNKHQREEMDFSKICENNDLPPDLEPIQ